MIHIVTHFRDITHLTFDCYGTLIDWEQGILVALQPLFARLGVQFTAEEILRNYVRHEAHLELQEWRPYRQILRAVLMSMCADCNVTLAEKEENTLADSLPGWPPFPDTIAALQKLGVRYPLVILSNTDDALFAETQKPLGVRFAEIITAEQVKSYKPGRAHFREALRRLGVPASQILHVAQSLYHDHIPARELGFRTTWVNRPSRLKLGLAPDANAQTDIVVPDLATLARQLLAAGE